MINIKSFKLDDKGDLVIENGDFVMIDGTTELVQSIDRILTTNKSEWFLDLDYGLAYKDIVGKGKEKSNIKLAIREAIFQEPRVAEVDIYDVTIDEFRYLKVNGYVISDDGYKLDLNTL